MDEHVRRRQRLQERMRESGIDGFLVTQNVDMFYFTGSIFIGYVFIPAEGESVSYVRRSLSRAKEECRAGSVEALGSLRRFGDQLTGDFPQVFKNNPAPVIATEFDVLPVQVFERLKHSLSQVQWKDGSVLIREIRMIKSDDEIAKIRKAAETVHQVFERALARLREGMKEIEWLAMMEHDLRLQGHLGIMRMRGYNQELVTGFLVSGEAAARPSLFDGPAGGEGLGPASPLGAGWKTINRNEPILADVGCCIDGYVIDQTRTVVIGELPDELDRAYRLSESILKETEQLLKPGAVCEDLYEHALEIARKANLEQHFMGYGQDQVKFLGHGIGLEVDEYPVLARKFAYRLEPGMVIAIEPKFTFPGRGVVGIENSYLITENGFEVLNVTPGGLIRV